MINNFYYKQIRQATLDAGFSREQIENATYAQFVQITGIDVENRSPLVENIPSLDGIKELLLKEASQKEDEGRLSFFCEQFEANLSAITNRWPNFVIEKEHEEGKLCIKVWPHGKPEREVI